VLKRRIFVRPSLLGTVILVGDLCRNRGKNSVLAIFGVIVVCWPVVGFSGPGSGAIVAREGTYITNQYRRKFYPSRLEWPFRTPLIRPIWGGGPRGGNRRRRLASIKARERGVFRVDFTLEESMGKEKKPHLSSHQLMVWQAIRCPGHPPFQQGEPSPPGLLGRRGPYGFLGRPGLSGTENMWAGPKCSSQVTRP